MSLKTLRLRVDHLVIAVLLALAVVVTAVVGWRALRPEPEQAEFDTKLERLRSKSSRGTKPPRFIRPRGAFSDQPEPEPTGWSAPQVPRLGDPGDLDPNQAVDEFKAVMTELEQAVEAGRRLDERQEAELYNRATGSFTALSAWVDGSDPGERALMDDAYTQMMSLMRQLDIQPPLRDPDGAPAPR